MYVIRCAVLVILASLVMPLFAFAQINGENSPAPGGNYLYAFTPPLNATNFFWNINNGTGVISADKKSASITWGTEGIGRIEVSFRDGNNTVHTTILLLLITEYTSIFSYGYDANGARVSRTPIAVAPIKSDSSLDTYDDSIADAETELPIDIDIQSLDFTIFPNPTLAKFIVDFGDYSKEIDFCSNMVLVSSSGQKIQPYSCSSLNAEFHLDEYPPGSYFLILETAGISKRWLVVKY
jgi:hypothetical protein